MAPLYKWVLHGDGHHCSSCLSYSGQVKRLDAWLIHPGFHPNCGCSLEYCGDDEPHVGEPTIFVSILLYPIMAYADQFNPIKTSNPREFPLCPYITSTNGGAITANRIVYVPQPITILIPMVIPVPVAPPGQGSRDPIHWEPDTPSPEYRHFTDTILNNPTLGGR